MEQSESCYIFAGMMKMESGIPGMHGRCIRCGAEIYGRTDKQFCSLSCKNAYNYNKVEKSRRIRNRVITALNVNYRMLESMLDAGTRSVDISTLEDSGFKPLYITGFRRTRGRYDEYSCFDIRYCRTENRVFNIRREEFL